MNTAPDVDDDEPPTFDTGCASGYSATPCRVVRGPAVDLRTPYLRRGGSILSTAEARALANALLSAADVADRNG